MPGLTQSYNLTGAPTQVFATAVNSTFTAANTVQVFNSGSSPVYIGQKAVSQGTGVQLNPGAHFRIVNMFSPLFAVAGAVAGTTSSTVATASIAGVTSLTVGTTTGMPVGTTLLIGNAGTGQETAVVIGTTATAATVSTALQFGHTVGETVSTATVTGGQIQVIPGVV
jgi:hypothetical protein